MIPVFSNEVIEKLLETLKDKNIKSFTMEGDHIGFEFYPSIKSEISLDDTLKSLRESPNQMPPDDQLLFMSSEPFEPSIGEDKKS